MKTQHVIQELGNCDGRIKNQFTENKGVKNSQPRLYNDKIEEGKM
jgi:hypothetical protein